MKTAWRYGAIFLLSAVVIGSIWIVGLLNPQTHFQSAASNVLALPNPVVPEGPEGLVEPGGQIEQEGQEPSETSSDSRSSSFNVVLIGTDTWGGESSRADTIMVAHVMPDKRKVNIVSVPRDTRAYVQGVGYTKINHAHSVGEAKAGNRQGTLTLIQAVSDFLNIPVHHYIKTNLSGVRDFIDSIGGIEMMVEQDVVITPEITIKQGEQRLDGQHVLFLARERYTLADGDFGRQREQFRIVRAVAKQLLKPEHIPDLAGLIRTGRKDILDTSFRDSDLISLAWMFRGMESDDFTYEQIPGKDKFGPDPLVGDDVYYWSADLEQMKLLRDRLFKD